MEHENPQLVAAIKALHQQIDDDPTSEKPLNKLIMVEGVLKLQLEIIEMSKETKSRIDKVLMDLTGKTISGFLDEIHEKAMKTMESGFKEAKEDIEGYLEKLKIVYRKVEKVILNPDEKNGIIAGSGNGVEKKELQTNKLQHLLELLRANEIYTDDICVVIGQNTPNMMREGSYLCIEIPKIKRTILLHPGYGEASFVLYDIYDRGTVFDLTKEEIQEKLGAVKVEYTERDLMKWGIQMLEALKLNDVVFQPKIDMEDYDRRLFYIEKIKRLFPTPEEFMGLTAKKKLELKICGKGLKNIATIITGNSGIRPIDRIKDAAILAQAIYGEGHAVIEEAMKEDETQGWTKEKWIEEIIIEYPTAAEFVTLNCKQKRALKIHGKGLNNLATIIVGNSAIKPLESIKDAAILAQAIYGEGHKVIEEAIKENETEGWDRDRWIEEIKLFYPTPEKFMKIKDKQKKELKIHGKGLKHLATVITGKSGLDPIGRIRDMAILAQAIYGEEHAVIEEAMKEDETEEWDRERWIVAIKLVYPTPEDIMVLSQIKKSALKIYGKGLNYLATTITGKSGLNPIGRIRDMAILAQAIYGQGHAVIEEAVQEDQTEGWNREKWIETIKLMYPTPEDFMALTQRQKKEFKIYGKGLKYLAKLITDESKLNPIGKNKHMLVLAGAIYGEECEETEEALKKDEIEKLTKAIKHLYPTPEDFMALTRRQKKEIKIHGKGLNYLATTITGKSGNPTGRIRDMAILAQAIYGEGHAVIDEAMKEDETEGWDREKYIVAIKLLYPTPEDFMVLIQKQKRALKIHGKGLNYLATTITGRLGLKPVSRNMDAAILASAVYGEGHPVIEEALKEFETEGWDKERWIEEIKLAYPTPEDFMVLNTRQKKEIKIHGKGLYNLATIITGKSGLNSSGNIKDTAALAQAIYGEGHAVIEEAMKEDETEGWDREKWIKEIRLVYPSFEDFMALNAKQKLALKFYGKGLMYLTAVITGRSGLRPIDRIKDAAILAQAIYGDPEKPQEE